VFFHTQLLKYGIENQIAAKVAEILVSEMLDEFLTNEEIMLAEEVCKQWLKQHQRLSFINKSLSI
jgi:mannose/cellobiose epimerase-like protein (N-acyl-D-glucosamine 2-epimerase family)